MNDSLRSEYDPPDYIDGFPVKYSDFMPEDAAQGDKPVILGKRQGVIKIKVAMCEDGIVRPTDDPENTESVKEISAWLKQCAEVLDLNGEPDA